MPQDALYSHNGRPSKVVRVSVTYGSQKAEVPINVSSSVLNVVKNLCNTHFALGQPSNYCLRIVETEELVTDDKLRRRIKDGDNLKLVSSPAIMVEEMLRNLPSEDDLIVKRTIFMLQKYLKEEDFAEEFIAKGGLSILQDIIIMGMGNTLAYALTSLQALMEHDTGWDSFGPQFISTLVSIIVKQNLVNICRPATAIIIKLVIADPSSSSPIQCYGFDVVNRAIRNQASFLPTLVHRLAATDYSLQLNSMHLINVLFRHATPGARTEFVHNLDALDTRRTVLRVMQNSPAEELSNQLVEFQRLLIQEGHRRKRMPIDMKNAEHEKMLNDIFQLAEIEADGGVKWRRLGFDSESPRRDLARVGLLGLQTMHSFVTKNHDLFAHELADQLKKPPDRRCPFARACVEVCEALADHWEVSTGYSTSTTHQPLLLVFEDVFSITLNTYFRLWDEMGAHATNEDVVRVANVLHSQFKHAVTRAPTTEAKDLTIFERDMMETPYSLIRERQLKHLEIEDDFMTRLPIRDLREQINKESYEFMKKQRISCLTAGGWFPVFREKGRVKGVMRFYRLGPNLKSLHYGDFQEGTDRKPLLEELTEKIDLSIVTDILTGHSSPLFLNKKNASENASQIFSLVSSSSSDSSNPSIADFAASSPTQFGEWLDGFNMLLERNIASKDTAEFVRMVTDVGVKLALLDITGEGVDLWGLGGVGFGGLGGGGGLEGWEVPREGRFWYDDGHSGRGGIGVGWEDEEEVLENL
ncbi:hypothetical protein HK097_006293 [Rhizophlyctis rosea]|uniref:ELMO domain-containing protein n=1 Tax=Rhizophlyctis rosea TaxID=64517 RepID=A0AAD5SE61_9FUNG|nr:hypothetical protein HK097_006293 [Rhizophlyctis rosea]